MKPRPIEFTVSESQKNRFWSHVNVGSPDQCWEWTGSKVKGGYGMLFFSKRGVTAHRMAWFLAKGTDSCPNILMHSRACCNPNHLSLGTDLLNALDACKKGRKGFKLTAADILQIRELCKTEKLVRIAEKFGLCSATVHEIKHRQIWNHL